MGRRALFSAPWPAPVQGAAARGAREPGQAPSIGDAFTAPLPVAREKEQGSGDADHAPPQRRNPRGRRRRRSGRLGRPPKPPDKDEDSASDKQRPDGRTRRRPRAPRPPRAHTTTNKDGDPPNKDGETGREARAGPGEDYGPEPIRAGACRVGGHQRQEGGDPKPPQAGERPTIAGGRRTGGQAAPQGWQRKGPSID